MKIREYIELQDEDGFLHFGDELVRCEDCKHGIVNTEGNYVDCTLYKKETARMNEHFCSYGERKTDENSGN